MSDAFIYAGGPWGNQGTFGQLGFSNPNFPSDANHVATLGENGEVSGGALYVTSSVALTATRNLILPLVQGMAFDVFNDTEGGQSINVTGSSGSGVTVRSGTLVRCVCIDGANYREVGVDADGVSYEPSTPGDWNSPPDNVAGALDDLSAQSPVYPGKAIVGGSSNAVNSSGDVAIGDANGTGNSDPGGSVAIGLANTAANADGNPSVAIGTENVATDYGVAIGSNNTTEEGQSGVAIGQNNTAQYSGVAIGRSNTISIAGDNPAVAIGYFNQAVDDSIAIGFNNSANGGESASLAMGGNCTSSAEDGVAIGFNAEAEANNAVAIGVSANVQGVGGVAIGNECSDEGGGGVGDVAIGMQSNATNGGEGGAVALGYNNSTSGDGCVTVGLSNQASGTGGIAIGEGNEASGSGIAIGQGSISNTGGVAIGTGSASEDGDGSTVAIGDNCTAAASGAVAIGYAYASNPGTVCIGSDCADDADGSNGNVLIGQNCSDSDQGSSGGGVAIGNGNTSQWDGDIAIGYTCQANSQSASTGSVCLGGNCSTLGAGCVAIGFDCTAGTSENVGSIALGNACNCNSSYQLATGYGADTYLIGERCHGAATDSGAVQTTLRDVAMVCNPSGGSTVSAVCTMVDGSAFNLGAFSSGPGIAAMSVEIRLTLLGLSGGNAAQTFVQTVSLFCSSLGVWTLEGASAQQKFGSASMAAYTMVVTVVGNDLTITVTPPAAAEFTGMAKLTFEFLPAPA